LQKLENGLEAEFQRNRDMLDDLHRYIDKHSNNVKKAADNQNEITADKTIIPVLVIACNRVKVSRCLDLLLEYRPDPDQFPIIVSQDCEHEETTKVIEKYMPNVSLMKQPDQSEIYIPTEGERKFKGYFKIARHYGWALNEIFYNFNFGSVIIVEDDLDIAPDFFEYFLGTHHLLKEDPTLWCISAWNDNGKIGLINPNGSDLLYRTDFFPGLGWMMLKSLWDELSKKWPRSYWDDWIRKPEQRKNRACIRPEISRTKTFGKIGVSNGLFFDKHLKFIELNRKIVPFTKMNLNYLLKENYDKEFINKVYQSEVVSFRALKDNLVKSNPVRIIYHTKVAFKKTAKLLGLMDDFKSGVPRMAYQGIITFFYNNKTVFLAPSTNWKGYDVSWV